MGEFERISEILMAPFAKADEIYDVGDYYWQGQRSGRFLNCPTPTGVVDPEIAVPGVKLMVGDVYRSSGFENGNLFGEFLQSWGLSRGWGSDVARYGAWLWNCDFLWRVWNSKARGFLGSLDTDEKETYDLGYEHERNPILVIRSSYAGSGRSSGVPKCPESLTGVSVELSGAELANFADEMLGGKSGVWLSVYDMFRAKFIGVVSKCLTEPAEIADIIAPALEAVGVDSLRVFAELFFCDTERSFLDTAQLMSVLLS